MFGLTDDQMKALDEKITLMNDNTLRSNLIKSLRDLSTINTSLVMMLPVKTVIGELKKMLKKGKMLY